MKILTTLLIIIAGLSLSAQIKIDTSFNFQSDPAKKLSIYLPSSYSSSTANGLMLALHPWNTSRWDAKSWRDTLIVFAEENSLILLCPDGGSDGQVNDPIDIAFTDAMLDSIKDWYNIDTSRTYCMGFSWGGKTTYTYGLKNPNTFCGYMPIGAAIDVSEVAGISANIKDKPIYIVHGQRDAFSTRFTPLKKAMEDNGGIVNSFIHSSGHTIDFPNRNKVLKTAFVWLDSVCTYKAPQPNSIEINENESGFLIYPNPIQTNSFIQLKNFNAENSIVSIIDMNGKVVSINAIKGNYSTIISPKNTGTYIIKIEKSGKVYRDVIVVK